MQKDENSGGFGLRGSDNIVRFNEISSCDGAAVRIGGDKGFGKNNHVYGNKIREMGYGAFNLMSTDHGEICDNEVSDATLVRTAGGVTQRISCGPVVFLTVFFCTCCRCGYY